MSKVTDYSMKKLLDEYGLDAYECSRILHISNEKANELSEHPFSFKIRDLLILSREKNIPTEKIAGAIHGVYGRTLHE